MNGEALFLIYGGFAAGIALIFAGAEKYVLLQKIKNLPTSKVRSAAIGMVELHGKARCKKNLQSPITKADCAYWRFSAQYYESGKHGGWAEFCKMDSSTEFFLEDKTGKILIEPAGAEVDIPPDNCYEGYISGRGVFGIPHKKIDKKVIRFINELKNRNIKKKFLQYDDLNVRIYEYYLADGDDVYVLGSAEARDRKASSVGHENLIIKKGKHKILYISDSHEKKLISRFEIYVKLMYLGFILLLISLASILRLSFDIEQGI